MGKLQSLTKLNNIVKSLQSIRGNLELQTVLIISYIAMNEGCSQQEVAKSLGLSAAAISRNMTMLGTGSRNKGGAGIIRLEVDNWNRRQHLVYLTEAGNKLISSIVSTMEKR